MQLSRFLVAYESVRPDEHVLYDVLADSYVGLNSAALAAVTRATAGSVDEDDQAIAAELATQGFLVADRAHDDRRLRAHLDRVARGEPGVMSITLMPTLACNLACTYCFQKGSPADAPAGRSRTASECGRPLSIHGSWWAEPSPPEQRHTGGHQTWMNWRQKPKWQLERIGFSET